MYAHQHSVKLTMVRRPSQHLRPPLQFADRLVRNPTTQDLTTAESRLEDFTSLYSPLREHSRPEDGHLFRLGGLGTQGGLFVAGG